MTATRAQAQTQRAARDHPDACCLLPPARNQSHPLPLLTLGNSHPLLLLLLLLGCTPGGGGPRKRGGLRRRRTSGGGERRRPMGSP